MKLTLKTLTLVFALAAAAHIGKADTAQEVAPSATDQESAFDPFDIDEIGNEDPSQAQSTLPEKTHSEKVEEAYKALKLMVASYLEFFAQQRYGANSLQALSEKQKFVIASIAMKNFFVESTCISGNFVIKKIKYWSGSEQAQDSSNTLIEGIAQELVGAYFQTALSGLYKEQKYENLTFKQKSFVWCYFLAQLISDSLHMSALGLSDGAYIASETCKPYRNPLLVLGGFSAGWATHWLWTRP